MGKTCCNMHVICVNCFVFSNQTDMNAGFLYWLADACFVNVMIFDFLKLCSIVAYL